jgi:phage-related protein
LRDYVRPRRIFYVLHCFVKKTQATRKAELDMGKQRYSTLIEMWSEMKGRKMS